MYLVDQGGFKGIVQEFEKESQQKPLASDLLKNPEAVNISYSYVLIDK